MAKGFGGIGSLQDPQESIRLTLAVDHRAFVFYTAASAFPPETDARFLAAYTSGRDSQHLRASNHMIA